MATEKFEITVVSPTKGCYEGTVILEGETAHLAIALVKCMAKDLKLKKMILVAAMGYIEYHDIDFNLLFKNYIKGHYDEKQS